MKDPWSRRRVLAAGAALASGPAFGAVPSGEPDVIVIGAGAAGIAAARRITAAGRRCVVVEASDRVGGRCVTDTATFGVPWDRGAHWVHMPDLNGAAKAAQAAGLEIHLAPPGPKLRIGRRFAREGEVEDYMASFLRANRAISDAARGPRDVPAMQALPKDLGEWRQTLQFVLGPFGCAKNLEEVSAQDFAKSAERDNDAFFRIGYGATLARLAEGLPIRLSTPALRVSTWGRGVAVETARGWLNARAVIVTASTGVLAADKIKFDPPLPKRHTEALSRLTLGSYDHVAFELEGNPLGLGADELVVEQARDNRTAALLANIGGTSLSTVELAGAFGKSLAAQGEEAMTAFATDWLAKLFGEDIRKAVKRTAATNWAKDPLALGAFSAAMPGSEGSRRILAEPVRDRLWIAGEATHETLWGTVGGAWASGEEAANAALRRSGGAIASTPTPQRTTPLPHVSSPRRIAPTTRIIGRTDDRTD